MLSHKAELKWHAHGRDANLGMCSNGWLLIEMVLAYHNGLE